MSKFTKKNETFVCEVCGHSNPPATKTCRNHCQQCLCSKHVDKNPGDRLETCHGILCPVRIEVKKGEMKSLIFQCEKCGKQSRNKIASDDNRDALFQIFNQDTDQLKSKP